MKNMKNSAKITVDVCVIEPKCDKSSSRVSAFRVRHYEFESLETLSSEIWCPVLNSVVVGLNTL